MKTTPDAKRILIYGDSYVFGKIPGGLRYDSNTRFTGKIQNLLGDGYDIIEEGLRGRTLSGENGFLPYRDGLAQFDGILGSHLPLNLIILALGTNDCNRLGNIGFEKITDSLNKYRSKIEWWSDSLGFPIPKLAIVAPPIIDEVVAHASFGDWFDGGTDKTKEISNHLKTYANQNSIPFIDLSKSIVVSKIDGIHLDINGNDQVALKIQSQIKNIMENI